MASQVFYRKFRSQTLAELVGQSHVTQTLLNALKNNNISHAYLFCGPRGTGKTSTARILAKAINCTTNDGRGEPCNTCDMCKAIMEDRAMDVIEIDAASNRGIDDIRDLREKVNYAPTQAHRKVYIIDEFHMLSREASNALLKTLEEPPPHVVFILATTEAHKVLPTILSRCQHFDFHRLSRTDVVSQLTKISRLENITIEPQSLQLIARNTTGSLRDAENLLEQLTTYYGSNVSFLQVQAMLGITGDARVKELVKYIINRDVSAGMATLNSVSNDGLDLKQFNRELIEYLRNLLLIKTGAVDSVDLTVEDISDLKTMSEKADLMQILQTVKLFGQVELGNTENTTLPLELALIECYLGPQKVEISNAKSEAPAVAGKSVTAAPKASVAPAASASTRVTAPKVAAEPSAAIVSKVAPAAGTAPAVAPGPVTKEAVSLPLVDHKAAPAEPAVKPELKPQLVAPHLVAEKKEEFEKPVAAVAPPVAPAVPKDAAQPPAPAGELEKLAARWRTMLEETSIRKTAAAALMRSSKPLAVEIDMVVLSFQHPVLRDTLLKPENQKVAEKIISDTLGRPVKIRCTCETSNNHLVTQVIKQGGQIISVEEK